MRTKARIQTGNPRAKAYTVTGRQHLTGEILTQPVEGSFFFASDAMYKMLRWSDVNFVQLHNSDGELLVEVSKAVYRES